MNNQVADLRSGLAKLAAQPDTAPWSMTGGHYTDPALFVHETETVLRRGWHCLIRADEIPQVGDFVTLTLLNEPILVVRSDTGIEVLSNLCRHRGMPLAEGQGHAQRFVCTYHAWTYGLDGRLLRAPRMKNADFDAKSCRLPRFASVEKFGFVYCSLAENPSDFDAELGGLGDLIGRYDPSAYDLFHAETETWRCNWKALVENFMEGYHLSVVHPQTLHGYTPSGLCEKGPNGPGFTSYFANYPNDIAMRGIGAKGLNAQERHRSTLFSVFPTQVASISANLLATLMIRPVKVDEIEVHFTLSGFRDELDADTKAQRTGLWQDVNREDRDKLEKMQIALASRHATGGPLAGLNFEGTVFDFLKWLARQDADT